MQRSTRQRSTRTTRLCFPTTGCIKHQGVVRVADLCTSRALPRFDEITRGVFVIAATPFLPDGRHDLGSVDSMVDSLAERNATGATILGMMGETGKLSADESVSVIRRVTARTALPVIVGVSAPGFAAMSALAQQAGAADEMPGSIPLVMRNFPLVTTVQISSGTTLKIVKDCPACVMLKQQNCPGPSPSRG